MESSLKSLFDSIKKLISYTKMNESEEEVIEKNIKGMKELAEKLGQEELLKNLEATYNFNKRYIENIKPLGVETYVLLSDVKKVLSNTKADITPLLMTTMKEFPRPIPHENAEAISKVQDYFDDVFILYTDYTGKDRAISEDIKKEKDPIAFGVMKTEVDGRTIYSEKLFYITDWIDEYCDLTLEKLVSEYGVNKFNNEIELGDNKKYISTEI